MDKSDNKPLRVGCPRGHLNGSHLLAHDLTAEQATRVIYALTAALADEETAQPDARPFVGEDSTDHLKCPLDALGWSYEPEMYAEYAEQMTEQEAYRA